MCHSWLRERLYAAEIGPASSYQKDGRPAPARLTTEASTATITGSSAARGGVSRSRRAVAIARLEYPLLTSPWCQKRWLRWRRPGIGQLPAEMPADWVRVFSLAPRLADFVGGRPRVPALVADQRRAHTADFDGVRLLPGADLAIGMFLGQVVQLVDGGLVVGDKRGLTDDVAGCCGHPVGQESGGERAQTQ